MTENRWAQIESISIAAMECDARHRRAFLDEACRGDETLRREVESLLGFEPAAENFLEGSALDEAARTLAVEHEGDVEPLQIAGYEMTALLGAGGMGEVYGARDQRLGRDVAVKLIRNVAADHAFAERFEEEARAASALNHPNIVTVHGVGSQEDAAYIVMELVRGSTLRSILNNGNVALDTTLDVAVQLADGLAAAHDAGIVHRDLKPENVMVTADGLVKILDFGIAKRNSGLGVAASSQGQEQSRVGTNEAAAVTGTAGYMSPEQAAGRAVDHRSDQFSFGAIVYELLAGHRAFERPIALSGGHDGPIAELNQVVTRCLAKDPGGRYDSTRDLVIRLRAIRDDCRRGVDGRLSRRRAMWLVAAGSVAGVAGVTAWRFWPGGSATRRLAVLPFANAAGDEDTDYLCDGLAESLIRRLSLVRGLEVKALSAVLHFKGSTIDPRAIGRQLHADVVLTGSVTRRAERLIVGAELVDVARAARLWGDVLDRPQTDVLAVQDEIAAAIIKEGIGVSPDSEDQRRYTRALTANSRAYDLYLQAVHHFRLEREESYLTARELLTRAISLDGAFALAHVTLASTYSVMAIDGYESPRDAWPQSTSSITRALSLDPDLPDAHAEASAAEFYYRWDWHAADREWEIALRSRRGEVQPELLSSRALQMWALGRPDEALQFAHSARLADPLSAACVLREADLLGKTGQLDEAATLYERVIHDTPDDLRAYFGLADLRRAQGRFDEAIDARRRAGEVADDDSVGVTGPGGAAAYAQIERNDAQLQLEELRARAGRGAYVSPLDRARLYARLGDKEHAFESLTASFEERAAGLVFLRVDPSWESLRGDPRFRDAVRRVGLPTVT